MADVIFPQTISRETHLCIRQCNIIGGEPHWLKQGGEILLILGMVSTPILLHQTHALTLSIIIINERAPIHYLQEGSFGQFVAVKLSPVLQQRVQMTLVIVRLYTRPPVLLNWCIPNRTSQQDEKSNGMPSSLFFCRIAQLLTVYYIDRKEVEARGFHVSHGTPRRLF